MIVVLIIILIALICFGCTYLGVQIGMNSNRLGRRNFNTVPPGHWSLRIRTKHGTPSGTLLLCAIKAADKEESEFVNYLQTLNLNDEDFPEKLESAVYKSERNVSELNSTIDMICQ